MIAWSACTAYPFPIREGEGNLRRAHPYVLHNVIHCRLQSIFLGGVHGRANFIDDRTRRGA